MEISKLLPSETQPKKDIILRDDPNPLSVVTWFRIAGIHILLGADLYDVESDHSGWNGVINSSVRPKGSASVYKISHHGSKKSDNPNIWTRLLTDNPYALLTPFKNGSVNLPKPGDVKRICEFTDNAFITSKAKPTKIKREKVVEQFIKSATKSIVPINTSFGQIKIRTKVSEPENWKVLLSGAAVSLHN